LFTLAKWGVAP